MLIFLIASAIAAGVPPAPTKTDLVPWDSPEFASALEDDRAKGGETVNLMVAIRLAGASWYVCKEGPEKTDEWIKRNRLSDAEELLVMSNCLTFWFGKRDMARDVQKVFHE